MPVPKREFLFLRHGQTDWNLQGRFQGHSDIPLNETGLSQAHSAAERLADRGIELVISSPLIRALKTAAIVAERIQRPLRVDSRLMERTFGSFEGLVVERGEATTRSAAARKADRLPAGERRAMARDTRSRRLCDRRLARAASFTEAVVRYPQRVVRCSARADVWHPPRAQARAIRFPADARRLGRSRGSRRCRCDLTPSPALPLDRAVGHLRPQFQPSAQNWCARRRELA